MKARLESRQSARMAEKTDQRQTDRVMTSAEAYFERMRGSAERNVFCVSVIVHLIEMSVSEDISALHLHVTIKMLTR